MNFLTASKNPILIIYITNIILIHYYRFLNKFKVHIYNVLSYPQNPTQITYNGLLYNVELIYYLLKFYVTYQILFHDHLIHPLFLYHGV